MNARVWKFGADLDTDVMAPGLYLKQPIEQLAQHCLEAVRPEFAREVRPGDVLVAGRNMGVGSSREQAPQALKALGVAAVIAPSFAGIFYRNALNLGLIALVCAQAESIPDGAAIAIDPRAGKVFLPGSGSDAGLTLDCEPIPAFLLEMVEAGGLLAHLQKRLSKEAPCN